jgi:hypothetical protein
VTCRSSVCQAACECSLIRPPRTGFRRACCVSMPVTVARGPSGSSSGTRCAMPWCGRAVLCAPGSRSGRRANVAREDQHAVQEFTAPHLAEYRSSLWWMIPAADLVVDTGLRGTAGPI